MPRRCAVHAVSHSSVRVSHAQLLTSGVVGSSFVPAFEIVGTRTRQVSVGVELRLHSGGNE